ncbi:MAG TPA: D-glycerate dehydrogenase [Ignavibacteriaceae bacterium]|nr:D-glycerate dehydrogenase [Ignavibacteriaceae bacterium]
MKIFITRKIPQKAINFLKNKNYEVSIYKKDQPIERKILLKNIKTADGLISLLTDKIDKEVIDSMKDCKVIANFAVGYNNIDVGYAISKAIIVTNTPGVLTDSTADLTMALVLSCARRINEGEKFLRAGEYTHWKPNLLLGVELKDKIFGILGAGRIGSAVATRAKAFGCKIIYFSRSKNIELEKHTGAKKVPLNYLLRNSDFVSVHLPSTKKTYHLLDKEKLSLLKGSAIFINTSRGEIVDEKELIKILQKKKIHSAGLDVFENELNINPQLLKLKNAVLLPHIGSATNKARTEMAMLAAKNIAAVLSGKPPITPV